MLYPSYLLPATLDTAALAARLAESFPLRTDAKILVHRRYLDTEGRHLAHAGGDLQIKQTDRVLGAIWEDRHSGKPMASCRIRRLPATVGELPGGFLRDTIRPLVGDAALHSLAEIHSSTEQWHLLDDHGNTQLRMLLEKAVCRRDDDAESVSMTTRVTLVPVAGQVAVSQQMAVMLEDELSLQPCNTSRLDDALALLAG